jgi:3',5'-cyclic-AMP phosphodiesterase
MPAIFSKPIDRREFVQTSFKALVAGVVTSRFGPGVSKAEDPTESLRLALLSDTHVAADPKNEHRKFFPTDNLKCAVEQVLETRPGALLLDGDVARLTGEIEDYEAVKSLLGPVAEQCPIYLGLGNHDDREKFSKVFAAPSGGVDKIKDKHVLVLEEPLLRVIILDSLLYVNKVPGLLGKGQREWLDQYLASADGRPTVLFVHHTLGDGDGELLDADALLRIVRPYGKVKAVFYGHSHRYSYRQDRGIHLINLPAVGYNFADSEPVGWVDARFSHHGVDLTLKALGGNTQQDGQTTALTWRNS